MAQIRKRIEPKADGSDRNTQNNRRLQEDQPDFKKFGDAHFAPMVIIGISHDETGEQLTNLRPDNHAGWLRTIG
jgi:hypothetical protein